MKYKIWAFFLIILITFGVMVMASAEFGIQLKVLGDPRSSVLKIIFKISIALIAFLLFSILDYRIHEELSNFYYFFSLLLLTSVFLPGIGYGLGTAKRWVYFGGFTIQPSEFVKIFMIIFFSRYIKDNKEKLKEFSTGIIKPLLFLLPVLLLIFIEPDFSTSFIIFIVVLLMLYTNGVSLLHILYVLSVVFIGVYIAFQTGLMRDYQIQRLKIFFSDEVHEQVKLTLGAIKSGGFFGKGVGMGELKNVVPVSESDFILSVIGEELGYIGILAIALSYIGLVWALLFTTTKFVRDDFAKNFIEGFSYLIILQVVINFGVNVGLLPVTGVTLPFVSQGGSSFLAFMMGIGVVVNVVYSEEREGDG